MNERQFSRRDYIEFRSPNSLETLESELRWRLCLRVLLSTSALICAIMITLIVVGANQNRLQFNVTKTELGDTRKSLPWLNNPLRIKGRTHDFNKTKLGSTLLLSRAMAKARQEFDNRKTLEKKLSSNDMTALNILLRNISDSAIMAESSIRFLMTSEKLTLIEIQSNYSSMILREWNHCIQQTTIKPCKLNVKFRTSDGSCNNIHAPLQGASMQAFHRILPPSYDDGLSLPRTKSISGNSLPSARAISLNFAAAHSPSVVASETKLTILFLTWGQFLSHDMVHTGSTTGENESMMGCCCHQCKTCDHLHPECFPINVGKNDPIFIDKGVDCLNFIRSIPVAQCKISEREQLNLVSGYIDGSVIYGSSSLDFSLRTHLQGKLRGQLLPDGRWLLPLSTDPKDGCNRDNVIKEGRYCFKAGDIRVNQQLHLTAFHTVWMREHNRIANVLSNLNNHWDDTRIYEESRRIVIAQLQHITYNEFVPLLLGGNLTDVLKLRPLQNGYNIKYNLEINAGVSNEFSTAAFRFSHSMLQELVELRGPEGNSIHYMEFSRTLLNPFLLWDTGKIDAIIRGSAHQCPRKVGTFFPNQVTNQHFVFESEKSAYGFDLFALNIQRGRDHGLAPYHQWRKVCNLSPVEDWNDLEKEMRPTSLAVLKLIYQDIRDIDLYVGIMAENSVADGILGPVGSCIIGDQFMRSKFGDRFWYETDDSFIRFDKDQLNEIRKTSLARILCDNGDDMDAIQLLSMERVSEKNPTKRCIGDEIPHVNLNNWKEIF